ncbi:MAG: nicotinate (nicotinamide) nucleotide adenylyltransferase [Moraxella sp.]|nr:nicotinate (nicotinamide) nucleotide adenylyltransferase [Moraxella sp.]
MTAIHAILGGSFNPVHFGHLGMAGAVDKRLASLGLPYQTTLMPSRNPFKNTQTKDAHLLNMLHLGCAEYNATHGTSLGISTLELDSPKKSYTLDTLSTLKKAYPNTALIFIIGQDSLESLETWKGGFDLFELTHFWVFSRGNTTLTLPETLKQRLCPTPDALLEKRVGGLYLDPTPIMEISSSQLRTALAHGHRPAALPSTVSDYITLHGLYQDGK